MIWMMLWAGVLLGADGFEWREAAAGRLELSAGGRLVFVYHHGEGRDCCYLHPITSPAGVVVTDDGPADHRHHRGLFWAWPRLESAGVRGDSWLLKGASHRFERIVARAAGSQQAKLAAEHSWLAGDRRILRETFSITARPGRVFEIQLVLAAVDAAVTLAGAPEQNKGYGGLSVRFAPRQETVLTSSEGKVEKDEDHGAHKWAQLAGAYEGGRAALRIIVDAANPGFPNAWCLRHYGFTGANFPGTKPYRIEAGQAVTLRYEVRVTDEGR